MPAPATASSDLVLTATGPPSRVRRNRRVIGWLVFAASATVLALAARLDAAPAGVGTHEQIGLPPCGWIVSMDLPCLTCGMTTSFAHAANGDLGRSLVTQPAGCLLALITAAALLIGLQVGVTGSNLLGVSAATLVRGPAPWPGRWTARMPWMLGAVVLGAWMYKIARHKGVL